MPTEFNTGELIQDLSVLNGNALSGGAVLAERIRATPLLSRIISVHKYYKAGTLPRLVNRALHSQNMPSLAHLVQETALNSS